MFFEAVLTHPVLHALGWALLHSLWQGALVALLLVFVLALLRGRDSNIRYGVACSALGLMLLFPAITFWMLSGTPRVMEVDEMTLQAAAQLDVKAGSLQTPTPVERPENTSAGRVYMVQGRSLAERLDSLMPWLIMAWLLGVLGYPCGLWGGCFVRGVFAWAAFV